MTRLSYWARLSGSRTMRLARRSDDAGMRRFVALACFLATLIIAGFALWAIWRYG